MSRMLEALKSLESKSPPKPPAADTPRKGTSAVAREAQTPQPARQPAAPPDDERPAAALPPDNATPQPGLIVPRPVTVPREPEIPQAITQAIHGLPTSVKDDEADAEQRVAQSLENTYASIREALRQPDEPPATVPPPSPAPAVVTPVAAEPDLPSQSDESSMPAKPPASPEPEPPVLAVEESIAPVAPLPASVPDPPASAPPLEVSDEVNQLRDNLLASQTSGPLAILLTSVEDSPDRGELAAELAQSLAGHRGGESVLVQADFRSGDHLPFGRLTAAKGLCEVLSGEARWQDAVVSNAGGMSHLAPGSPAASGRAIDENRWLAVVKEMRQRFRYLVVDAGACGAEHVAEMGRHCDAIYLVLSLGLTDRREAVDAADALTAAGGRVAGCIVANVAEAS